MDTKTARAVLITGCSSGIGHAIAGRLATRGFAVWASARDESTLAELAKLGCQTLALDVTDEESMRAAVEAVERVHGSVAVLVNNAGYSQTGVIETVPMDKVRAQFETNVFGLTRLCQLVLPGMRRAHYGRIVNVSSMGGRLTFPGFGYYHASKYAVEAISDALRFEVRGFGVDVVLIEPGLIRTRFGNAALATLDTSQARGPYANFVRTVATATEDMYGKLAWLGAGPEDVARVVERVIRARRPAARYPITASARFLLAQRALFGDRAWDLLLRMNFPSPGADAATVKALPQDGTGDAT